MTTSMTGFYPWVGFQVNDRVSVWGTTGYGAGALRLTPDGQSALEQARRRGRELPMLGRDRTTLRHPQARVHAIECDQAANDGRG